MHENTWYGCVIVTFGLLVCCLSPPALGDPNIAIQTQADWENALLNGNIKAMGAPEWDEYMMEWSIFKQEGQDYPPTTFIPPEPPTGQLYVWDGGGGGGGAWPQDAGLVMMWQASSNGAYAGAWTYDYQVDPDLSNSRIRVTVTPPSYSGITVISFGIQDVGGAKRAWYWNVGLGGPIPYDVPTTIIINTSQIGLAAATPAATGYMDSGVNLAQAQYFIVDENAQWIGTNGVPPPGQVVPNMWNYWHDLVVTPLRPLKWDQPPDPIDPGNVFLGWNEYSVWESWQVVADDWYCDTNDPVTDIHWWGSYLGWKPGYDPPDVPDHFHITIWTDVPASTNGTGTTFSHPGYVVHEIICSNFTYQFVGWDYDPRTGQYEACFAYQQDLLPSEYFYQESGGNIYWISIAAHYLTAVPQYPWGWKTRPRDRSSLAPDDAVRIWDPTAPIPGSAYLTGQPIEYPPGESWDMAFELTSIRQSNYKWQQWPVTGPTGCYYGWDEFSIYGDRQIVADDWACTSGLPVTDIHWWGSYQGWNNSAALPPDAARGFHIGIWADVPATTNSFSHPDDLIWESYAYLGPDLLETIDGCDEYAGIVDTAYRYDYYIPPTAQWFYQDAACNVFWLSIAAIQCCWGDVNGDLVVNLLDLALVNAKIGCVVGAGDPVCDACDVDCDGDVDAADAFIVQSQMGTWPPDRSVCANVQPDYPWGWKTREHFFNDDAVRIFDPTAPIPGDQYLNGEPIEDPPGVSWDMAFLLTTDQVVNERYTKWSQPPVPYVPSNGFNGWNEYSVWDTWQVVADDWACTNSKPVTDVHWWGSFLGWYYPWEPWPMPDMFHIGIWTDVPATSNSFSHPDELIWENWCSNFSWYFVGWDWDPRDPLAPPEACFKFEQYLDPTEWFYQDADSNSVYWISIAAVYTGGVVPQYPWGWKTRPNIYNDDAVDIWDPPNPSLTAAITTFNTGQPIEFPLGFSWDMAFQLTSLPQCAPHDVNCDGATNGGDLLIVKDPGNWLCPSPGTPACGGPMGGGPGNDPANWRADVNGSGTVNGGDLLVIKDPANWLTSTGPCWCP